MNNIYFKRELVSASTVTSAKTLITFATAIILLCLTLTAFLSGCNRKPEAYQEQLLVFGTLVEIKLWDVEPEQGRQAIAQLADDFNFLHRVWHAWNPGSLSRINQLLPAGEKFSGAPSVLPLIIEGQRLSKLSGGLFNPAIGNLIKLWGFESDDPPKGPPPDEQAIEAILKRHPSMEDISIDGIELQCSNDAVRLDFGGFAKGVAIDNAIQHLREMGINNAIVNAGGDLRIIGSHGERPWRIGIRNPRGAGMLASVDVSGDESVVTSGDYERFFEYEGVRYYHIIDPRTGYPARGAVSVTVFDEQAGKADAAATALFVAGPEDWYDVAKAMGVKGVMLVDTRGVIHMTPNLKDRIHFDVEPVPEIILSEPL